MQAITLTWQYDETNARYYANIPFLEHSVGAACFTVAYWMYYDCWKTTFWHGNRGHEVLTISDNIKTKEEAQEAAQQHLNKLVEALTNNGVPPCKQKYKKP